MDMTNQEYGRYVSQKAKPSPLWKNLLWAFVTGGLICTGGQALLNLFRGCGLNENAAGTAVSVTIIFLAALFTGLGLFDKLAKHAGAGTLVPITGFANAVVSPALEFKCEGLVMGVGAKMFVIAGPVLAYGISASFSGDKEREEGGPPRRHSLLLSGLQKMRQFKQKHLTKGMDGSMI